VRGQQLATPPPLAARKGLELRRRVPRCCGFVPRPSRTSSQGWPPIARQGQAFRRWCGGGRLFRRVRWLARSRSTWRL